MANETFKAGDVVELKSGSPKLTVNAVEGAMVNVDFYDENIKDFRQGKFPAVVLMISKKPATKGIVM